MIEKVTSCGTTFAALSSIGDVFTFSLPNPLDDVSKEAKDRHVTVKPQLIWALRKSFTAVKVRHDLGALISIDAPPLRMSPSVRMEPLSYVPTPDTSSSANVSSPAQASSSSDAFPICSGS